MSNLSEHSNRPSIGIVNPHAQKLSSCAVIRRRPSDPVRRRRPRLGGRLGPTCHSRRGRPHQPSNATVRMLALIRTQVSRVWPVRVARVPPFIVVDRDRPEPADRDPAPGRCQPWPALNAHARMGGPPRQSHEQPSPVRASADTPEPTRTLSVAAPQAPGRATSDSAGRSPAAPGPASSLLRHVQAPSTRNRRCSARPVASSIRPGASAGSKAAAWNVGRRSR